MKHLQDTKFTLSVLCAACIGMAGMWHLSHVMAGVYWSVVMETPVKSLEWFDYANGCVYFLSILFFGFYLPLRWERQQREANKKNEPKKHTPVYTPRPMMRDNSR